LITPRSTSGARQRSTASARRAFYARCAPRICSVHSLRENFKQIARLEVTTHSRCARIGRATPARATQDSSTAAMTAAW
jgi:hypothetical protein